MRAQTSAQSASGRIETVALILNYRTADKVVACLEALRAEGIEFALIWDNSADRGVSAAEIRRLAPWPADRLHIVESDRNLGFGSGVNRGLVEIRNWRGEVAVLLVNSDARAQPGMITALWKHLVDGPSPTLVAPLRTAPSGQHSEGAMYYHRATGLLLRHSWPGAFLCLNGCCLLIPPSLAGTALFDEAFFFYGEDCELSWRMSRNGVSLRIADGASIWHEGSGSSIHASPFYEYHMVRSHFLMATKTARTAWEKSWFTGLRIGILALRALVRTLRSRRATPLREYGRALSDHFNDRPASAYQPQSR